MHPATMTMAGAAGGPAATSAQRSGRPRQAAARPDLPDREGRRRPGMITNRQGTGASVRRHGRRLARTTAATAMGCLIAGAALAADDWTRSKWGPDDEIGAANNLSPEKVLEAAQLI